MSVMHTGALTTDELALEAPESDVEGTEAVERPTGPFGGLSASEAARRSIAKQREKKADREAAAQFDALTVQQRAAVVAARSLTMEAQTKVLEAHIESAGKGKVQSARFVLDWLKMASGGDPKDEATTDWQAMTPAKRAAWRAEIDAQIDRLTDGHTHAEGQSQEGLPANEQDT